MARRSPQTERLVEMIEILAALPQQEYRLTELARMVRLDAATCYPMLTELTRVGWLVKDRVKKTYRLGPRLIAIGMAAHSSLEIASYARSELELLSRDAAATTCLILPSSDDLVIADLACPENGDAPRLPLQAGDHIEFRPPLGAVLIAWAGQFAVDMWLRRAESFDGARSWEVLRTIRQRRFAVEISPVPQTVMRDMTDAAIGEVHGTRRAERLSIGQRPVLTPDLLLGDIDEVTVYTPLAVSAACFGPSGVPVAAISVLTMARPTSGRDLWLLGARIGRAADEITERIGGQAPRT